ncbi:MAG: Na+/H+ antiporter subunit A, partial [Solibacillus sp.]
WVASIFTFIYSFYFVFRTFTGKYKPDQLPLKPHEAPIGMLISPMILASLVIIVFFIPNFIGDTFVKPAVLAIQPFLYNSPGDIDIQVAAWHGKITTELYMTIGIVLVGFLLFVALPKWQKLYNVFPRALTLNNAYDKFMLGLDTGLNRVSRLYMTGSMRHYLLYMFSAIVIIVIGTLITKDAFTISFEDAAPIHLYGVIS